MANALPPQQVEVSLKPRERELRVLALQFATDGYIDDLHITYEQKTDMILKRAGDYLEFLSGVAQPDPNLASKFPGLRDEG